ncbi:cupin [Candidatus Microgenomates bacterium]|nr:MAG: cupin [Candidatus Microgenomates bacterium]
MIDLNKVDKSKFTNEEYVKKVEKPWGYELHWTPENKPYMGKIFHINAGAKMSLQIHDQKQESWLLISGKAKVIWDNKNGKLIETELEYEKGFNCEIGQKHRLVGITDCIIIEVSTPETGTTLRLEDDYKRPDETPEQRKIERGEI